MLREPNPTQRYRLAELLVQLEQRSGRVDLSNQPRLPKPFDGLRDWIECFGGGLLWLPDWAPDRLVALSVNLQQLPLATGLLSSRLGRRHHTSLTAVKVLHTASARLAASGKGAIYSTTTPASGLICRALARRGVPAISVLPATRRWRGWAIQLQRLRTSGRAVALLSPPFGKIERSSMLEEIPVPDRVVAGLADDLVALHIRPRGAIARLFDAANGFGITTWRPNPTSDMRRESQRSNRDVGSCAAFPVKAPVDEYLLHCTRAPAGAWPGETDKQYLDALLAAGPPRDAFATLCRIVSQGKLAASASAIRGGVPVVCFSQLRLEQILRLRRYRAHRNRWDFEPYGIGVSRRAVERLGGRPVRYGDESTWRSVAAGDRTHFQKTTAKLDWRVEAEWRVLGDFDLRGLAPDEWFAFAQTAAEAEQLARQTAAPCIALDCGECFRSDLNLGVARVEVGRAKQIGGDEPAE